VKAESVPEPQDDASPDPAPNLMLNKGGLS
jgi:hypothetical protein